jgi:RNA polymerase sigma factor (sigma-70 family)
VPLSVREGGIQVGSLFSALDIDALVASAQAEPLDDSSAMEEVVRRFEPLARKIASGMTRSVRDQEDAANAARWGVVLAVRAHTPGRRGFPSYARRYMHGEASRRLAQVVCQDLPSTNSLEMDLAHRNGVAVEIDYVGWGHGQVADVVACLTPRRQNLLVERFVLDRSQAEIAAARGVSVSAVNQQLKTALAHMRTRLDSAA